MKTTLVAVSGKSPAILTETIWALSDESPPILPDEVVVITTVKGKEDIVQELLAEKKDWGGSNVWNRLRKDIFSKLALPIKSKALQLSIRVIDLPDEESGVRIPADDIRSRQDIGEAADFIVRSLSEFCDQLDNQVIVSIAGGRKTMGALLYGAISLIGKESDRVTHVLVDEPFDSCRGFFYPKQPAGDLEARPFGKPPIKVAATDAIIELADIPFVPLRNKFTELSEPRLTFAGLVSAYSRAQRSNLGGPPRINLAYNSDMKTGTLTVEGRSIKLSGRELLLTDFLYHRAKHKLPHYPKSEDAKLDLEEFRVQWKREHPSHQAAVRLSAGFISEVDFPNALDGIRKKLKAKGLEDAVAYLAPSRSRIGFDCEMV